MPIYFANKEPMDIRTITTMGVSVKNTNNPIGYFGTGLKYTIAILLRNGHGIRLITDGEEYVFTSKREEIRGKPFELVYMNDTPLGFTTDLGKNWEMWMAFRELYSNCLDENGVFGNVSPDGGQWGTVIEVTGESFEKVYDNLGEYFIDTSKEHPLSSGTFNIYESFTDAPFVYAKGIRAGSFSKPSLFRYSQNGGFSLSEDRSFSNMFMFTLSLVAYISRELRDVDLISRILTASKYAESVLDFGGAWPRSSEEYKEAVTANIKNFNLNPSALSDYYRHRPKDSTLEPLKLSSHDEHNLQRALSVLEVLGAVMFPSEITVTKELPDNVLGAVIKGKIYIAERTMYMGIGSLVGTIYEEWVHREHGYSDETREFQNHLIDKLAMLAIRIYQEKD